VIVEVVGKCTRPPVVMGLNEFLYFPVVNSCKIACMTKYLGEERIFLRVRLAILPKYPFKIGQGKWASKSGQLSPKYPSSHEILLKCPCTGYIYY